MPLRADISLITVDLDDTLWPCEPVILAAERELHHWLGRRTPRLALAHDMGSLREHRRRLSRKIPEIAHDFTALRRQSLQQLLEDFEYPGHLAAEAMELFLEVRNRVEPYAEVPEVLRHLGESYTLVATTNGNADVERTPLQGLFHHAINAAEAGAPKPAPDLFLKALDWAGVDPTRALHLGDDPRLDIAPAQDIGMQAVWVNRNRRDWPPGQPPAEHVVSNLEEFVEWLRV
jgi:putative hydrolase of the HAD superfamily